MHFFQNQIIKVLLSYGQFGINLPGGTDFVILSTQSLIDQYLPNHTKSTHVILLLDKSSRRLLVMIIHFFNILYSHQNTSWVCTTCTPAHTWETIIQDEGFAQCNPLGPLSSALTLSILLKQINSLLHDCSEFRSLNNQQPNDDTLGSQSTTLLFLYIDISFLPTCRHCLS
jgi:hypothetical protein